MFSPYSAKAENLKARNNLTEVLLRDSQGYLTFERTAKCSTDLVSFEKDIRWTVQCMLASDYLHNKQDLTKQISPHVPNILWLHFSRFILKSPLPMPSVFSFFLQGLPNASVCTNSARHSLLGDSLSRQWNYAGQDGIVTIFFRVCLQYGKSS